IWLKHTLTLLGTPVQLGTLPDILPYYILWTPNHLVGVAMVDNVPVGYCDSNKRAEPRQVWVKKLFDMTELQSVSGLLHSLSFPGVHVVQVLSGCELDSETGEVHGYRRFGYDGEEFMSDTDNDPMSANLLTNICPQWLKDYLNYGRNFLERRDLPSVSLLQKTASSPVTCHATGFYPDRADLFWTKDGEELHEDVDKGEILPNHDGSFQMSVDLNISSIAPEDWKRYHCVFQLSGVKDDIKTKLDKAAIRTNRAVVVLVVFLCLFLFSFLCPALLWVFHPSDCCRLTCSASIKHLKLIHKPPSTV
uniref:Ig-like domain-containing protein n=1 Tax=Stegastes partitus TaxID=144197 RepID=A0A3B4ZTV2_9TELE